MEERQTHHWPPEYCYYCGEPAVAGCDGVEHYNGYLLDGTPRISMKDPEAVTKDDILEIRQRHNKGESQADLAKDFGVTRQAIYLIVKRKNWKHV